MMRTVEMQKNANVSYYDNGRAGRIIEAVDTMLACRPGATVVLVHEMPEDRRDTIDGYVSARLAMGRNPYTITIDHEARAYGELTEVVRMLCLDPVALEDLVVDVRCAVTGALMGLIAEFCRATSDQGTVTVISGGPDMARLSDLLDYCILVGRGRRTLATDLLDLNKAPLTIDITEMAAIIGVDLNPLRRGIDKIAGITPIRVGHTIRVSKYQLRDVLGIGV